MSETNPELPSDARRSAESRALPSWVITCENGPAKSPVVSFLVSVWDALFIWGKPFPWCCGCIHMRNHSPGKASHEFNLVLYYTSTDHFVKFFHHYFPLIPIYLDPQKPRRASHSTHFVRSEQPVNSMFFRQVAIRRGRACPSGGLL